MPATSVRKPLLWIGVVFVVFGGGFLAQRGVAALRAALAAKPGHAALLHQEDLARADGMPLTAQEFDPGPPVTDAENAAPLYRQAAAQARKIDTNGHNLRLFDPFRFQRPDIAKANRAYLAVATPVLDLIAEAAKRPKCQMDPQGPLGQLSFSDFSDFKLIARVVACQAELEAHSGRPAQALDILATYAPMSGQLTQINSVVGANLHSGVDGVFTRVIADVLGHHGREAGVPDAANRALKALGALPDLVRTAEAENIRVMQNLSPEYMDAHTRAGVEAGANASVKHMIALARTPGMVDRWRAVQIESSRRYVELFKAAGDNWRELEKKSDALKEELATPNDDAHAWRSLVGSLDWTGTIDIVALRLTERRVLETSARALEGGSAANVKGTGQQPAKLDAPLDPLSGHPLRYRPSANGFTVYGVGAHGVDHGGRPRSKKSPGAGNDVVFTYPAPEEPEEKVPAPLPPKKPHLPTPRAG